MTTTETIVSHSTGSGQDSLASRSSFSFFQNLKSHYDEFGASTKAIDFWQDVYPRQSQLISAYIIRAFAALGCDLRRLSQGEVVPPVKALDKHNRLIERFHQALQRQGIIVPDSGQYVRTDAPMAGPSAEALYNELLDLHPQHAVVHKLIKVVGSQLADCLSGKADPLSLLFGDRNNKKLMSDMYEFWPLLRAPTLLLGRFLEEALRVGAKPTKYRILEIGAGTGGTTRHLIECLQRLGIEFEYVFTDIGSAFVAQAKRQFKTVKGMSFEVLDIEKPPKDAHRGFFDFIISTNCIHATKNLETSLSHLHEMLSDNGVLSLIEVTTRELFWLDIVVGLFEGWWSFEDDRTYALVDEAEWAKKMGKVGFRDVAWTGGDAPESKSVRVVCALKGSAIGK